MRNFLFAFICIICFACNKNINDKKLYLRGRLFVTDSFILHKEGYPLARMKVMLANNDSDSLNFIYSDTTDADGYFIFNLLDNGINSYKVRYADSINGYKYYGNANASRGDDNIVLNAFLDSSEISGVKMTSTDSLYGGIPGAQLAFYSSLTLAHLNNIEGASYTAVADAYGDMYSYKLTPRIYYVNSKKIIGNAIFERIAKRIEVKKGQRLVDTLILQRIR